MATATETEDVVAQVNVKRLEQAEVRVAIEGITPLIPHKWSEKSLSLMRDKQFGKTVGKHAPKDPKEEAEASIYRLDDGRPGMPATAFKSATVGACALFGRDVTKVVTKQVLHIVGEGLDQLVPIEGMEEMREDTPRNSGGTVDLRYRFQLYPWSAVLVIRFLPQVINASSIAALVDAGGRGGVGDWRPSAPKSSTGTYGQYRVVFEEVSAT